MASRLPIRLRHVLEPVHGLSALGRAVHGRGDSRQHPPDRAPCRPAGSSVGVLSWRESTGPCPASRRRSRSVEISTSRCTIPSSLACLWTGCPMARRQWAGRRHEPGRRLIVSQPSRGSTTFCCPRASGRRRSEKTVSPARIISPSWLICVCRMSRTRPTDRDGRWGWTGPCRCADANVLQLTGEATPDQPPAAVGPAATACAHALPWRVGQHTTSKTAR